VGLKEGKNTIAVTCIGSDAVTALINSIELVLNSETLEINEVLADGVNLFEKDAPVSTDVIKVKFNADIDLSAISNENVKLYMGENEAPVQITAEGNVITVALKQSLKSGESCRLLLNGVGDSEGIVDGKAFELEFDVDNSFSANAVLVLDNSEMKNENLTVSGSVKSSQNIGISGRRVMLFKAENLNDCIAETVSGENGVYLIKYTMPQGSEAGLHNFVIKTEYAENEISFSNIYVTAEQEDAFLNALKATESADDVKTL